MGALYPVACAVAVFAGCSGSSDKGPVKPDKPAAIAGSPVDAGIDADQGPTQAIHSMVLFGAKRIYLSHISAYGPPYDYQVVLEIRLRAPEEGQTSDPMAAYLADRRDNDESLYTVVPEAFELEDVQSGTAKTPFRFAAGVYRGHFERGGESILDVEVEVLRVIHFRKLDASEPVAERFRAMLVGAAPEQFAVHYIGGRPSFEQIVAVSGGPLGEGPIVALARGDDQPLQEKDRVEVRLKDGKKTHSLRVDVDVYTENAELGE